MLGSGIAQAFRSDRTPPFADMLGSLFGGSNPQQRAGVLGELLRSVAPAVLSGLAGGALGRFAQSALGGGSSAPPAIGPDEADRLTPEQVKEVAVAAEKADPGVLDKLGTYYAQHPELVKILGGTALAIALGQVATRMKR